MTDDRRAAALATMTARFDGVAAHFREVYGLRLPRDVAVLAAFWASLDEQEAQGIDYVGLSTGGILDYFLKPGVVVRKGLDERLHCRFRLDLPEFVTIMFGDSDGLHFGLWYDDPAELPTFVVHNYARDSAENRVDAPTGLATILELIEDRAADGYFGFDLDTGLDVGSDDEDGYDDEEFDPETAAAVRAAYEAVRAFAAADQEAVTADGPTPWSAFRGCPLGIPEPALPDGSGNPRVTDPEVNTRIEASKDPNQMRALIAEADAELQAGQPAFALVLGRELHFDDQDEYREDSLRLMVGAYLALGRDALAEIATVHHAHRDLGYVDVLTRP